ncbi:MAG TPA: hypothetical protein VJT82_07720 [Pyrinomonadaceae bacterium]|nr:hypothetical protein [Pyrinomonadaceae bacterium]
MFLRALVLSVLILCSVAATLPLTDSLAHWSTRPSASRRHGRYARRHSRAWWRRYRARLRRKRALAAERRRRRALVAANGVSPLAPANHAMASLDGIGIPVASLSLPNTASLSSITPVKASTVLPAVKEAGKELPRSSALPLPQSWSSAASSRAGEMRFNVRAGDGRTKGSAVWSRVNLQSAAPSTSDSRSKTFGGVPTALLRRTVINRMVAEGGWVVNDMERQFGERRVFVVIAHSAAANGERRAWTFYFTESDGQVYSLATTAPADFADTLAAESEQAVVALGSRRAVPTTAQFQR